ncbi:MAG: lytic transglycosylase domain-containing protein [Spirochaetes bacterium]|nr:lytic transglycosylase domain-containing protein [Spirochaetota bacterium]
MRKIKVFFLLFLILLLIITLYYVYYINKSHDYFNLLNFNYDYKNDTFIKINFDENNNEIRKYYKKFENEYKEYFIKRLKSFSIYYNIVSDILVDRGFSSEFIYLSYIESEFKSHALSSARASGLWQFMEYTGLLLGLNNNQYIDERKNLISSTYGFTKHFKYLYNYYKGNLDLALAAYNCGHGRLNVAIKTGNSKNFWELADKNFIPKETKEYVPKFYGLIMWARNNSKLIESIVESDSLYVVYKSKKFLDLKKELKNNIKIIEYIKEFNPHLKSYYIPEGTTLVLEYSIINSEIQRESNFFSNFELISVYFPKRSLNEKNIFKLASRNINLGLKSFLKKSIKE